MWLWECGGSSRHWRGGGTLRLRWWAGRTTSGEEESERKEGKRQPSRSRRVNVDQGSGGVGYGEEREEEGGRWARVPVALLMDSKRHQPGFRRLLEMMQVLMLLLLISVSIFFPISRWELKKFFH